jgi:hypothetical protein
MNLQTLVLAIGVLPVPCPDLICRVDPPTPPCCKEWAAEGSQLDPFLGLILSSRELSHLALCLLPQPKTV